MGSTTQSDKYGDRSEVRPTHKNPLKNLFTLGHSTFFKRACSALALTASLALCPYEASAQSSAAEKALAAAYDADSLFARGKWEEAHDRFKEADDLAHSPVFVLYMARSRRNAGKLIEAATIYERVLAEKLPADAPKPFRAALTDASAELTELRAKTPTVRAQIVGDQPADLEVRVDGQPLPINSVKEMDPGTHTFVARGSGRTVERKLTLASGDRDVVVAFDFNEIPAKDEPSASEGSWIPGIITLSVGGVGLGIGAVTGAIAAVKASDIKENCVDNHCLTTDAEALSETRTLATVSTVGFIAGGAVAAAGIVLLIVRPGGTESTSVSIGPKGIQWSGTF
jgi:hypothetical protein